MFRVQRYLLILSSTTALLLDYICLGTKLGPRAQRHFVFDNALKENNSLTALDLFASFIGDESEKTLADTLKCDKTLNRQSLGGDMIRDEGAKELVNPLEDNQTLTILRLGRNDIGKNGAKALTNALVGRKTSAFLHLRNFFGNWSFTLFANALFLDDNEIGEELHRQIQDWLARNKEVLTKKRTKR